MKTKIYFATLSLFAVIGFSIPARSAVLPMKIPSFPLTPSLASSAALTPPLSVKSVPLPLLPSAPILPCFPAPIQGPISLPGAHVPLPLSLPSQLSMPQEFPDHDTHLDWSFLDGDDHAAAMVAHSPAPKPLSPKGAAAQLIFAAKTAKKRGFIHIGPDELFDQASPRLLVALP